MTWEALQPRHLVAVPDKLDPYLRIADAIGFADHLGGPNGPADDLSVSIALRTTDPAYRPIVPGLQLRSGHDGSRHFTARATLAACEALLTDPGVARLQLAQPILPQRWRGRVRSSSAELPAVADRRALDGAPSEVLLGVIENGCPFAHAEFLDDAGQPRLLRLWDQNTDAHLAGLGAAPRGFGYGRELTRSEIDAALNASRDISGAVDDVACYRRLGLHDMLQRRSHGAHTLGLAAGRHLRNGRPQRAPAMAWGPQRQSVRCDIVFVQLPQILMDAICVPALEHHALDGLRYILRVAADRGHKKVVVPFGYESWMGPHDGTSWFESALDELIHDAAVQGIAFEVLMVAGNARDRSAHAAVDVADGAATLWWTVPPDNEVPTFLEVWTPNDADDLTIELTPPGGQPLPPIGWDQACAWPTARHPRACLVTQRAQVIGLNRRLIVLRIAPTRCSEVRQSAAPHGEWRLDLRASAGKLRGLDAYLGRSEASIGPPTRSYQPQFTRRSPAEAEGDRQGTLNGHAGGQRIKAVASMYPTTFPYLDCPPTSRLGVARPRFKFPEQTARYSGEAAKGPWARSVDYRVAVEDGLWCGGVIGMGNYRGVTFRMSGTSTAAPLAARVAAVDGLAARKGGSSDGSLSIDPYGAP